MPNTSNTDFDSLIGQLRRGQSMADHAGAPQGELPDFLKQFRKQYNVGKPVSFDFGTAGVSGGGDKFQRFVNAIAGQESGSQGYGARNRSSGALGKYQIMPANIPSWSKSVLGRSITAKQFMKSPALQDKIAQTMLRRYVNKYGYSGAAAAWYGGPGVAKNWSSRTNPQGAYPSIASYVNQIMRRMG